MLGFGSSKYKKVPIGYEDFKLLIDGGFYYVDKTMLIYDLLQYGGHNNLITRPRRFGKTLNFSMLRYFFDINERENSYLFNGMEIMRYENEVKQYRNAFPVISLSMKCAKQGSYSRALHSICMEIREQFIKFSYVLESDRLTETEKKDYRRILECEKGDELLFGTALKKLSMALSKYYGQNTVIFIDEYDMPIEDAWLEGYYNEMVAFIRTMLESALKTNPSLQFSVITGSLHILNESIFSAINNIEINSIRSDAYSEYFGFTEKEIEALTKYYNLDGKQDEIFEWYGGYQFGESSLCNPWSVLHQIKQWRLDGNKPPQQQWRDMSYNEFVSALLTSMGVDMKQPIMNLIKGEEVRSKIYDSISFKNVENDIAAVYTFMYYIGYLTIASNQSNSDGNIYSLRIPNREICGWYKELIVPSDDEAETDKEQEEAVDVAALPEVKGDLEHSDDNEKYSCILE